jgi:hypothetical protein
MVAVGNVDVPCDGGALLFRPVDEVAPESEASERHGLFQAVRRTLEGASSRF